MTDLKELAKRCGFTVAEDLDVSTLQFLPEVREMCAADRCQHYGRNWACPPACGTLEECEARARRFHRGIIVQTVGDREDSMDFEAMIEIAQENSENLARFADALADSGLDFQLMGAGGCSRCKACTYPDAPCRFPDKVFPSMEACGLNVSGVCKANGVPYNYGAQKLAYTGCLLYNE